MEALSRIIALLNERFGLNLGPEHRVTLGQMMEKLDGDVALDPGPNVFLVHGECADGRPQVFKTGNGLAQHVCGEK